MSRGNRRERRERKQQALHTGQVMAPDTTPPGSFRHPFKVFMLRKGSLVSVDRSGNPLVQGEVVAAVIQNPQQLQKLANELTAGKYLCTPYAFTMQVANGIAQACRGLVDDSGEEIEYPTDSRKETDNAEDDQEQEQIEREDEQADEPGFDGAAG